MSFAWGRRLFLLHVASITIERQLFTIRDQSDAGDQAQLEHGSTSTK